MKKNLLKISSLGALCVAIGAGSAVAQEDEDFFIRNKYEAVTDRSQPEFDPLPIRTDGFEITPEVSFTAGATSNLFATGNDEVDDYFLGIRPSIDVRSTWSRHALGLRGRIDHIEYGDTSSESRTNLNLGGDGRLDVSREVNLFGAFQADDLTEPRSNIASVENASEPVEYTRVGGEAGIQYEAGRLRIRGAAGLETFDYDDVALNDGLIQDQDFRDRDVTSLVVRTSYAVERDWAVFAEVDHSESDYDGPNIFTALNRDFSNTSLRVGTDFELRNLIRGDIGIGAFQSEYDDPTVDDVSGLSVDGGLQWFASQLTTLSFGAGRGVIDPGLSQSNAAVRTNVSARADHELRRNVIVSGEARFTNFDFENVDRNDDRWNLRAAATWKVNPNLWVDGSYELTDQSSNVQDFSENRFLIGLRIFP
ncbi:MAG: outer membrane beta-barrel protein [Henriciella sp.]